MAPPRKNVTHATTVAPTTPKEKGKGIEAPADRQTNLSDVHIHYDEDSHSSSATSQRVLAAELKPQNTGSNSSKCSST